MKVIGLVKDGGERMFQVEGRGNPRAHHARKCMMCCENCKFQYGWNGARWGDGARGSWEDLIVDSDV